MGYLCSLESLESVCLRVAYGTRVGTVRALADALRACKHPYGLVSTDRNKS